MTIQDVVRELNISKFKEDGEAYDSYVLYKSAATKITIGKLEEARQDIKKAIKLDSSFDDAKLLYALLTFAMGNRIDGLKLVNDIGDNQKRLEAMSYIDGLSGVKNWRIEPAAEKEKEDFSKRFESAKQAQEAEFIQRGEELSKEPIPEEKKTVEEVLRETKAAENNVINPFEQMIAEQKKKIEEEETFNPILTNYDDTEPTDKTVIATDDVPQLIVKFKFEDELEEISNDTMPEETEEKIENKKEKKPEDDQDEEEYTKENVIDKKKIRRAVAIIGVCVIILAAVSFIAVKLHMG